MKKFPRSVAGPLLLSGLLIGCAGTQTPSGTQPSGGKPIAQGKLQVLNLPAEVQTVNVQLEGPENREASPPITNGTATATFENLLGGSYVVTARGYDNPDRLITLYKARATTTFAAPLNLKLNRLVSGVNVTADGAQSGLFFSAKVGGSRAGLNFSQGTLNGSVQGVPTGRDQQLIVEGRNASGVLVQQGQVGVSISESDVNANVSLQTLTYQAPAAPSLSGPATIRQNELYTLQVGLSNPSDSTLESVRVDWGDGSVPTREAVSGQAATLALTHTYTTSGTQTITTTVTNAAGVSSTSTLTVQVQATVNGTVVVDNGEELSNLNLQALQVPAEADRVQVTLTSVQPIGTQTLRPQELKDVTTVQLARDRVGEWGGKVSLLRNTSFRITMEAYSGSTLLVSRTAPTFRTAEPASDVQVRLDAATTPAELRTVAAYVASSDPAGPTAQGWTASVTKAGSAGGSVVTDGGAPAWKVDGVAGRAQWLLIPTQADGDAALGNGWRLTSVMRMESGAYINDYYANGRRRFLPTLAISGDRLQISLEGGPANVVLAVGAATTAYHTYVQEYDPATGLNTLTFDGVRVASWAGATTSQNYVAWGDGSIGTDSVAYYRSVKMEIRNAPKPLGESLVFLGGRDGSPAYRIPSLAITPRGTLLAAAEGRLSASDPGAAGQPISINVRRSVDGGLTWQPNQAIMADNAYDFSDPRLVVNDQNGDVFAFFARFPDDCGQNANCNPPGIDDPRATALMYRRSTDDGQSWEPAVNINAQVKDPTWRTLNSGPGRGVQLRRQAGGGADGRLIFPAIVRTGDLNFATVSIYSDDAGATWQKGELAPIFGPTESDLVELADGTLLLSSRNDGGGSETRYHFRSTDGGVTWISTPLVGVRMTRVDASMLTTEGGGSERVVLSGPLGDVTATGFAGNNRTNLGLWISSDGGRTFPTIKQLNYGVAAYSAIVALPGGDIGVLYEQTGSTQIHFSRVPASILQP